MQTQVGSGSDGMPLRLRSDDVVGTDFLLELLLALLVLVGTLAVWTRWFGKRLRRPVADGHERLRLIAGLQISPRARMSLIDVDGARVLLTETPQAIDVRFVPSERPNANPAGVQREG